VATLHLADAGLAWPHKVGHMKRYEYMALPLADFGLAMNPLINALNKLGGQGWRVISFDPNLRRYLLERELEA
jgi:hypothetical protein